MKINAITNNNIKSFNFCAGKTKLYTDFDGTYFPSYEYLIFCNAPNDVAMIRKMYKSFQDFLNIAKEQFEIIISTGRDMFDFAKVLDIFKKANVDIPEIHGYVFEDGFEEMKNYNMENFSINPNDFPNKLYQPKEQVRKIVENNSNDLVIVAGNEWNDVDMLNPLNYIDIFNAEYNRCLTMEELLDRKEVIDALQKLPLISIVASDSRNISQLLKLKELLDKKGIHKIFHAKKPEKELLQQIKKGMQVYCMENSEYKNNLGLDLKKEIMNN